MGVVCLVVSVTTGSALATDGDIYGSGSSFSAVKSTKAKMSPVLRSQLSIPPEIVEGVEFKVDCVVEAMKNQKGAPRKGVKGSLALFAVSLDISSRTWEFFGLRDSGIPFKTKAKGTSVVTSGTITAGPWANDPSDNDTIFASVLFNNTKKIKETSLYCEVVVGE